MESSLLALVAVLLLIETMTIGEQGVSARWKCAPPIATAKVGRFSPDFDGGNPRHNITSGYITLLDERRAAVPNFSYDGKGPFTFWNARLRSASGGVGTGPPLDQLGNYRDNLMLAATGTDTCDKAAKANDASVLITLPPGHSWNNVAWVGLYCWGYKYVFNFAWINPTKDVSGSEADRRFNLPRFVPHQESDVAFCAQTLKPCPDKKNVEFNLKNFCYRDCELNKQLISTKTSYSMAGDTVGFRCGVDLRDSTDLVGELTKYRLYGCKGRSPEDPNDDKQTCH